MKLTLLFLTLLQSGPIFRAGEGADPFELILNLMKVFGPIMVALILFRAVTTFFGGGQQGAAAVPPRRPAARPEAVQPALVACGFCGSRLTSNKLSEGGNCPRCGGPVEA